MGTGSRLDFLTAIVKTKCCGIDGRSDWLFTNANQTRFFGEIPQTCCLPEDRKNVTIDGHMMQFCNADDTESIFPGCGEQFTTYSVRKNMPPPWIEHGAFRSSV